MYDIIGAVAPLAPKPIWFQAVMVREGDDVVTRCCVVAQGELFPIEVRVNVPALIRQARALGLDREFGSDTVSGFGSFLKKAVKTVTKNKVVKAVGKVAAKVVKSPIVQIANPMAAVAVHTSLKAATGKGTIKGPLGQVVDAGSAFASKAIPSPLSFISPKATAALGVGLRTVNVAKAGDAISAAARNAQKQINLGRTAASAIAQKTVDPKKALPFVKNASALKAAVTKAAPALAKQVVLSSKVKAQLGVIAQKAKAGSTDAKLAANVIAQSAKALDTVARLQGQAVGGLPGLLITAQGKIVRAPKGRFQLKTTTTARPDILYRGAKEPTLKGIFAAVAGIADIPDHPLDEVFLEETLSARSRPTHVGANVPPNYDRGPEWGGHLDPSNEMEGPRYPVQVPGGGWKLDDYSALPGNMQVAGRFGDPPERYSTARFDRSSLKTGDKVKFAIGTMKRTGVIDGVTETGHFIVRSKPGHQRPEEFFTIWPGQVTNVRIGFDVLGGVAGALTP